MTRQKIWWVIQLNFFSQKQRKIKWQNRSRRHARCRKLVLKLRIRDAIRAQWGEKGVIDLAFALQMGRMYPMMKAALGYAKECRRISVDGKEIDVVKQAA